MADENVNNPSNAELVQNMAMGAGTLGAKIVELGTSLAVADQQGQIQHLSDFIQPLLETPPVTFEQVESMPGDFEDLTRSSQNPAISMVNAERFAFQEADFEFDMAIGSHTEVSSETDVKIHSETEIKAGWGPVGFKQSISADISHNDKQTRSTDMTAKLHMSLKMGRENIPEGLAKAIDMGNEFSRVCNQLRLQIAGAEITKMQQQIQDGGAEAAPAGGDAPPADGE